MESRKGADKRLDSIDALRRRVPVIVKRLNDEPALALRAAANRLFVLQEMGIELTDRLAAEVELCLRFRPEQVERLQQLRANIQKRAGEAFDVDDPVQVHRVLFDHLKLSPLPPLWSRSLSPSRRLRSCAIAIDGAKVLAIVDHSPS